jgi:U3 small nucleolar ribonucleoprotein protein IMP4
MPPTSSASSSHRRAARLRREYLYRKSLAGNGSEAANSYESKKRIRDALASGKPLPTELRANYAQLKSELKYEDAKHNSTDTDPTTSHVDDEYGNAGHSDPQVVITTSRDPSSRLKQFAKEMKVLVPNSTRINRGNIRVDDLVSTCQQDSNITDLVVLQETRGEPDGLVICHLPLGPTAYFTLSGAVLRHDLEGGAAPMSEAYPHIILDNFNTALGRRVGNILKCLFPVPKADTRRIVTFRNDNDHISFRHHVYSKEGGGGGGGKDGGTEKVKLFEVGPRFEMRLYQIKLGTLEMKDADNEYVLKPYMNTASKRTVL